MSRSEDRRSRASLVGAALVLFGATGCGQASASARFGSTPGADVDGRAPPAASDGTGGASATAPDGAAPAAACLPPLASCDDPGRSCCGGSVCVEQGGGRRCVSTCTTRFDCGSLCCLPDSASGKLLCASSDLCPPIPCSDVGGECGKPGFSCCGSMICVASTSSDYGGCRKPCTTSADCDTKCCVPFSNGQSGFCAAASACECATENGTCGGTQHCCNGLTCASSDTPGTFACKPTCTTDADCSTRCCVGVAGTNESVCSAPAACGH